MNERVRRRGPLAKPAEEPSRAESRRPAVDAAAGSGIDLPAAELSHPVNASRIAGILGDLQHSVGNRQVQRMLTPAARSSSFPLDPQTRSSMEAALGGDLSAVRLHTGEDAAEVAGSHDASAVTRGNDIYFADSEYDPASSAGREVLAHELTHVVQQSRAERSGDASLEQEARDAGRSAVSGNAVFVRQGADPGTAHPVKKEDLEQKVEKPKAPEAPKPPAKPEMAVVAFHMTPALAAAIERISMDPGFEERAIEIFIAGDAERPKLLLSSVMLFPDAAQEIARQQPPNLERSSFLEQFARFLWTEVHGEFLKTIDHRYQSDKTFQKRVDRAKGKTEPPAPGAASPAK
jgi:hypothetical protein